MEVDEEEVLRTFVNWLQLLEQRSNNVIQFVDNFDFMCIDHHHLLLLLLLLLFADYLTDLAASCRDGSADVVASRDFKLLLLLLLQILQQI